MRVSAVVHIDSNKSLLKHFRPLFPQVAKAEAVFGKCVAKCADNNAGVMKGLIKDIDAKLKEIAKK